jgi:uncharacterized delta-60 repeat protein
MDRYFRSLFFIFVIEIIICSCAVNSSQPITPDEANSVSELTGNAEISIDSGEASHYLLAYNFIYVDPDYPGGPKVEIIPVRVVGIHLNILKFLEDGPCTNCFKIAGLNFPQPGYLDVDIEIDHPFVNTPPDDPLLYSVFDVRGIMMFQGSHEFPVAGKSISDPSLGDGAILNADGYTALYNGSTITAPVGDLQKYYPGNMATPAIPDSDVNGFKYFMTDDPSNDRNAFFAGSSDVQTFSMKLPTGPFVLGYAIDANWWTPTSHPVDDPLTDFDSNANCPEPWKVVVTEEPIGDGLTETGGQTTLTIDVYDWQGKSTHHAPVVECPEIIDGTHSGIWGSNGDGFARYEATISNTNLAPGGIYKCLISVEANENDPVGTPWLDLTAYKLINLEVSGGGSETGNLIWAKRAGGVPGYDYGYGVTTLSDNSTVVTGLFSTSATFGAGEAKETVLTSFHDTDLFIARYNPDGTLAWAKSAGGIGRDEGFGITALSDNSTVVTGLFYYDSATFGLGEPNETVLYSAGAHDIFIARYNPDGTLAWAKSAGGTDFDISYAITTLSDNSVVVTGQFGDSATFGLGEINETVLTSEGSFDYDIFVARYNPDGTLAWAKSAGGIDWEEGYGITSLSDNSTVVTGGFTGSVTFGPSEPNQTVLTSSGFTDIFIARYNPDGTLAWVKSAGGVSYTNEEGGYGIISLSDNSTVVTGEYKESATFGHGESNETVLTSAGDYDLFVARYNPDGTLDWAKTAGGTSWDKCRGITALSDNSTVVTGFFYGTTIFGPGESNETVLTSAGYGDIFIARYNPDGTCAWAKCAGASNDDDYGFGITALSDNSTVATGYFSNSATFGKGEPNETVLNTAGSYDIFIARFFE